MKAVFWLGHVFNANISFPFQAITSLYAHFMVSFRYIWREIVFRKGLVKFMEIGNFEDCVFF